jgi:hypothetical protein
LQAYFRDKLKDLVDADRMHGIEPRWTGNAKDQSNED